MSSRTRQRVSAALGLGLAVAGLQLVSPPIASAASSGIVISEFYGNGGNANAVRNADFIELYNPTASPIDLAGTSVQYRSATGAAVASGVATLSGTVQPGKTFLVRLTAPTANGTNLPAADLVATGVLAGGTNGTIWIANGTSAINPGTASVLNNPQVIDLVGFGTSNTYETAAATGVTDNTKSFSRTTVSTDNDNNSTDFAAGTPTPTNAAGETLPEVVPFSAADPGDKSVFVGQAIAPITLTAVSGTAPITWQTSPLPAGLTLAGNQITGTPTTVGTTEVTITATDASTPAQTDTETFSITVSEVPAAKTIAEIQGDDSSSPEVGKTVVTTGVVTAIYPAGGFNGLYLQTPGADTDGSSDAIFVYGGPTYANIPTGVALGDSIRVTGAVSEFNGLTQISPTSPSGVTEVDPLGTVTPRSIAYPTTEATREDREGELVSPTDTFTVTNTYNLNTFAEIGLATGNAPLRQPTEYVRDDDSTGLAVIKAENAERAVSLDDGSSLNYMTNATAKNQPLPWLSPSNPIRVGAEATLTDPVVLDWRNSTWKFQPTAQVTDSGADVATFTNTRTGNENPVNVPGDLKIATFNVLNYFNTTGEDYLENGAAARLTVDCDFYEDRAGNPIAVDSCGTVVNGEITGNGVRGAATEDSFLRQQAKIVTAINRLDADIVALEEIENSIKLPGEGNNRDDALVALVNALNTDAGSTTWKLVTSPTEAVQSGAVGLQDVIRSAFIYKPQTVDPVGASDLYLDESANANAATGTPAGVFANAREPLAQAFKPRGALDSQSFAVIANHFKSKGDSDPAATGDNANNADTGAFNGDRTRQAQKLAAFAEQFASARGIEAVFLAGDFNSYTHEDPMHVLYTAGYEAIESSQGGEETYSFSGLSGSVDHVLGNEAAMDLVVGADIWDINAAESIAFQYSRFNYNATNFFQGDSPFAASDHNPAIVGLDLEDYGTDYSTIQLLATNDFHGRLLPDGANGAGAAVLAGAVKELEAENPDTVFAAAGDLIGASTFESFIQDDEPTIEALNEAGLDVSAAGNHEFDKGYDDFLGRVHDRADWEYIAANVEAPAGEPELADSWTETFDTDAGEIKVGFVGAVTEDLPSLVAPAGIAGVTVTDIVDATNAATAELKSGPDPADLVVLLVHEGASQATYTSATDETTAFGHIVNNVDDDVDAIVSGHTHLAYSFAVPVPGWADRAVKTRPVVSAGQYGTNLNQLLFTYDNDTDDLVAVAQDIVGVAGAGFEPDAEVADTVAAAKAEADIRGAVKVGEIEAPFNRAKLGDTTTENRGGESTLGNLVAEVQRWATETPEAGAAQIAFMNPGGLRADMIGTVSGAERNLTYKDAAVVQPFANTLVNMDLTGEQIEKVLEQQWQRDSAGNVPSRAFLRLGVSEGLTYTYYQYDDPAKPGQQLGEVTGIWLDGAPISPTASYSVTVNSFLASGGDNFFELNNGTGKADTGKVDLEAMIDYLEEFAETDPLPVDYSQRAVGVRFPAGAPATYGAGDRVVLDVSSWSMSTGADIVDTELQVKLGAQVLGTFPVTTTIGTAQTDEQGTASVDVVLPASVSNGAVLTLEGASTGTKVPVPLAIRSGPRTTPVSVGDVSLAYGRTASVKVTVDAAATGTVQVKLGAGVLGSAPVVGGVATVILPARSLAPGRVTLTASYSGDGTFAPASKTFGATVAKARSVIRGSVKPKKVVVRRTRATLTVRVAGADGVKATGSVRITVTGQRSRTITVRNGRATLKLKAFSSTGRKKVTVQYLGSALLERSSEKLAFTVRRKR
ncbi:ExeM/NucH family extracellular endonuclease [Nocardioides sp. W7]|uniref:ExeM/NucH family extracellular endonuclease n=1 Tax=Nocardioides sp. W7 TaxID=2931390 RepID=UPI001FD5AADD|nr:ExeM/NucH family extracellular endonuclease [Nocardioides sp. W7]